VEVKRYICWWVRELKISGSIKAALIVLTLLAVSSAVALVAVPAQYGGFYFLKAEKLSQQPVTYFVLENPDAVVSKVISNPQETVEIRSLEGTQIDELINEHDTHNVQVNGSYYQIWIGVSDSFPPFFVALLYLISPVSLPLSLVLITIILVKISRLKSNK
jgi:4-amino-4-deoxy-L-arabinose transferase-like glycosyltransferase